MDDKNLKDMWNKADIYLGISNYVSGDIEEFMSGNSISVSEKIRKMLQIDISFKLLAAFLFLIDAILYYNVQPAISVICMAGFVFVLPLVGYELNTLRQFSTIADNRQSTKEKMMGMLTFLRSRSFTSLLAMSSTYLFGFTAGILVYFFAAYGELRKMNGLDIFVFPTICFIGIVLNYVMNSNTIKFQVRHLELCLSDLDEEVMPLVSRNIAAQQKSVRMTKLLIGIVALLSFLIFVIVLKELGY